MSHSPGDFVARFIILSHDVENFVRWKTNLSHSAEKLWGEIQFCLNVENFVRWIRLFLTVVETLRQES